MIKRLLLVRSRGLTSDVGLLILRLGAFTSLFLKHGLEKIEPASFWELAPAFPDPAHIGHLPSLLIATISDALCSFLLVLGIGTRFAATYISLVLSTAWAFTHHFIFLGKGIEPKHGELIVMYITQSLAVAVLGPGKFSFDWLFWRSREGETQAALITSSGQP